MTRDRSDPNAQMRGMTLPAGTIQDIHDFVVGVHWYIATMIRMKSS